MEKEIIIAQKSGRTIVLNEVHLPDNIDPNLYTKIDNIGMTLEKITDQKIKIDKIFQNDFTNIVRTAAFINVNGMSNLMNSTKYKKEVDFIQELGSQLLRQSFLRLYWNLFKEINHKQGEVGVLNFYSRKAAKIGFKADYTVMHFAFEYDPNLMIVDPYLELKANITKKRKNV